MNQGDVYWYTFKPPDKRRPILILTRNSAIPWGFEVFLYSPKTKSSLAPHSLVGNGVGGLGLWQFANSFIDSGAIGKTKICITPAYSEVCCCRNI
jgi:hypothetical protein